ncbi:MAG: hypothetical protein OEZ65_10960 [Gemmatimonadota bacterium]|nr:hypothetical protein [Gemmatimonadota bacterium]
MSDYYYMYYAPLLLPIVFCMLLLYVAAVPRPRRLPTTVLALIPVLVGVMAAIFETNAVWSAMETERNPCVQWPYPIPGLTLLFLGLVVAVAVTLLDRAPQEPRRPR